MKKILYVFITLISCFFLENVSANSIKNIDMEVYIDSFGNAHVVENWTTSSNKDTEFYKTYKNMGHMEIEDFEVSMDGTLFENIPWNINSSFDDKKYKNGINYISDGVELCFGITDYGVHTYKLSYTIHDFVVNTIDGYQMVYFNLMPETGLDRGIVKVKIYSDFLYEDTLDVWGYGYTNGYAYVSDGYISLDSNNDLDSDEYMTVLIKYPANTFTLNENVDKSFDEYLEMAEEGAIHYEEKTSFFEVFIIIISFVFELLIWAFIIFAIYSANKSSGLKSGSFTLDFGEKGRKLPKDLPNYRDIPCNKDIIRAYFVAYNYKLMKNQTDFLGAILLKWLKQNKIEIKEIEKNGLFKTKKETSIYFKGESFDNELEESLYNMMYEASKDGILEEKEFEKWCQNHYTKILNWFNKVLDYENKILLEEGKLEKQEKKTFGIFTSYSYKVDESLYEEACKMAGLKKFLKEFSNIKDRKAIEVSLWEEYLMYAQIFGIAKEVAKEFKEIYPDVIPDYSYESIVFVNHISYVGMSSARSAKERAESYSSGGGGFSSGGGGGGSFGGGGSMGSR